MFRRFSPRGRSEREGSNERVAHPDCRGHHRVTYGEGAKKTTPMTLEEIGERLGILTVWRASFQELKSDTHGIGSISFAGFTPNARARAIYVLPLGPVRWDPKFCDLHPALTGGRGRTRDGCHRPLAPPPPPGKCVRPKRWAGAWIFTKASAASRRGVWGDRPGSKSKIVGLLPS